MRPGGDPTVSASLDQQARETLYLTTVTVAELLLGVELLPLGLRRSRLDAQIAARRAARRADRRGH